MLPVSSPTRQSRVDWQLNAAKGSAPPPGSLITLRRQARAGPVGLVDEVTQWAFPLISRQRPLEGHAASVSCVRGSTMCRHAVPGPVGFRVLNTSPELLTAMQNPALAHATAVRP